MPDARRRVKRCAICREPGHAKTAHTPMEQQRFRLTGQTVRRPTTGEHPCAECFAPAYSKHEPHCRRSE